MEVNRGTALFRAIASVVSQSCTGQPHHRYLNPESALRLVGGRPSAAVIDWKNLVTQLNLQLSVEPRLTIEEAQSCNTLADIYKILSQRQTMFLVDETQSELAASDQPTKAAFNPRQNYTSLLLAQQLAAVPEGVIDSFGRWIAAHPEHRDGVVSALSNMLMAINKHNT